MGKRTGKAKRRGSSRAGRPRKAGARFPGGKLRNPGPNETMIAKRRELCDDVSKATCPLDVAVARGWITPAEHRAGMTYAATYRQTGINGPVLALAANQETARGLEIGKGSIAEMSREEIHAVWESAFRDERGPSTDAEREEQARQALNRWRALNAAMPRRVQHEMHAVCIQEDWPSWAVDGLSGPNVRFALLIQGLRTVMRIMRPVEAPPAVQGPISPVPDPKPVKVVIDRTYYVTPAGEPLFTAERIGRKRSR